MKGHGMGFVASPVSAPGKSKRAVCVTNSAVGGFMAMISEAALRGKLKKSDEVHAEIDATLGGVVSGVINKVQLSGKDWASPMDLTCRDIRIKVAGVEVDFDFFSSNILKMRRPVMGTATVEMNGDDFSNFLMHPLVGSAELSIGTMKFAACPVPRSENVGGMHFSGLLPGDEEPTTFFISKEPLGPPVVSAAATLEGEEAMASQAAGELGEFFSSLCLELDGTKLRYFDIKFDEDLLTLQLGITIEHLLSPKVNF